MTIKQPYFMSNEDQWTRDEEVDVKLNGQMLNYYKSINDNSATDGANTLKIFAMSKNQI